MATSQEGDEQSIGARVAGFLREYWASTWDLLLVIFLNYYANVFHNENRRLKLAASIVGYLCVSNAVWELGIKFAKRLHRNQATARAASPLREAVTRATAAIATVFADTVHDGRGRQYL